MYNTFIWDFDGTIFDSYPHITAAMVKMAKIHNIKAAPSEIRAALEINFKTAYDKYSLTEEQIKQFREYESDYTLEPIAKPFDTAEEVLKKVVQNGYKNFLYTHRAKESTFYYLEKYNLKGYFSGFITADDNFPPKPYPDALLALSKKYGINAQKSLMIGDREIDVQAGLNAGMTGCLISTKSNQSCAKYIICDISKMLNIIV